MCNFKFHCGFAGCKDWVGIGPRRGTGDCNYTGMKKHYKDFHGFEPNFDNIDSAQNCLKGLLPCVTLPFPSLHKRVAYRHHPGIVAVNNIM